MKDSLDFIRHIELPLNFICLVGWDGTIPYWTFDIRFPAVSIQQNKNFTIKNFAFNPSVLNCYAAIGSTDTLLSVDSANIQIFGLTNQGIEKIITAYGSPAYVYNGVSNNTETNINTAEILPNTDRGVNTGNNLSITNLLTYPTSATDLICQKSPGFINKVQGSTTLLNFTPTQYWTDFYFKNTNFKKMLFFVSLPRLSLLATAAIALDYSVKGFISFDLYQFSSNT